jgi:mono/diheme cytochrome c family protein
MIGVLALTTVSAASQSVSKETYDFNFIGQPLADPVLQHAKETFVLFGCAYCHGLNLVARGEATDLMHSRLVGQDVNGNLIGPLLRAGISQTAKLSPMPQFSDLSDQQIGALVLWIHYARSEGRFKELTEAKDPPAGDAGKGEVYFNQKCASCHSVSNDLAGVAKKYGGGVLKTAFLKPKALDSPRSWKVDEFHDAKTAAKAQHQSLLENYSAAEASNVTAFLATLK